MKIKIKKRISEAATGFKSIDELKEYRIVIKQEYGQYVFYFYKIYYNLTCLNDNNILKQTYHPHLQFLRRFYLFL